MRNASRRSRDYGKSNVAMGENAYEYTGILIATQLKPMRDKTEEH